MRTMFVSPEPLVSILRLLLRGAVNLDGLIRLYAGASPATSAAVLAARSST
jgi:hypothetical protein